MLAQPSHGNALQAALVHVGKLLQAEGDDGARGGRVHSHPEWGQLQRKASGELEHSSLRGAAVHHRDNGQCGALDAMLKMLPHRRSCMPGNHFACTPHRAEQGQIGDPQPGGWLEPPELANLPAHTAADRLTSTATGSKRSRICLKPAAMASGSMQSTDKQSTSGPASRTSSVRPPNRSAHPAPRWLQRLLWQDEVSSRVLCCCRRQ